MKEPEAKSALARQFAADPKGFHKALDKLEKEMNSGRTVEAVHTRMNMGTVGRTLSVQYNDGRREEFGIGWNGDVYNADAHNGTERGLGRSGSQPRGEKTHEYSAPWKDSRQDGVRHTESYDVDKDGNVSKYHYSQEDESDKSVIGYDYHTETWFDTTKGDGESGVEGQK